MQEMTGSNIYTDIRYYNANSNSFKSRSTANQQRLYTLIHASI